MEGQKEERTTSSDGKFSFDEIFDYIVANKYPEALTKAEKNSLRKRSKFFRVTGKDLYYVGGGKMFYKFYNDRL